MNDHLCQYEFCNRKAVANVCYSSNFYENDKYMWVCKKHRPLVEVRRKLDIR